MKIKINKKVLKILLWFFIGLLSLGQLQRIELTNDLANINIYFHDIFISIWLMGFASQYHTSIINNIKKIRETNLLKINLKKFKLEIIFIGITLFGITINLIQYLDFISLLYLARLIFYILFAFSLRFLVKIKQIKYQDLRFYFISYGFFILILGFLQLIFIGDTRFLAVLGWDDHFHRLISTIFDPNFTGIILVISFLYIENIEEILKYKRTKIIVSLFFLWGIAATFSRASYLTLFFSLFLLSLFNSKKILNNLAIAVIFLEIILIGIPKIDNQSGEGRKLTRTSTIIARQTAIEYQLSSIKLQTLLFGNGLFSKQNSLSNITNNIFKNQQKLEFANLTQQQSNKQTNSNLANLTQQQSNKQTNSNLANFKNINSIPNHSRMPDNLFVNILLSTGVVGTILAIILAYKWIAVIIKIDEALGIAIIATIISSQFSNSLLQPFVLLLLLGGVVSVPYANKKNTKTKV